MKCNYSWGGGNNVVVIPAGNEAINNCFVKVFSNASNNISWFNQ